MKRLLFTLLLSAAASANASSCGATGPKELAEKGQDELRSYAQERQKQSDKRPSSF